MTLHSDLAGLPPAIDLVLLDRDGVINHDSPNYITHPDAWQPLPGALEAIVLLQQHAAVAVCTNQSAVGRGLISTTTLLEMHDKMNHLLDTAGGQALDVFYCPHRPADACQCRKPAPGLLLTAMHAQRTSPARTVFIGDSARDLQAADAAQCVGVLVKTGNGEETMATDAGRACQQQGRLFDSLSDFATALNVQIDH